MKIVVIGASGTIGSAVVQAIKGEHEVVKAGKSHGDVQLDMTDPASIRKAFDRVGSFDGLVVAAGEVAFKPFSELDAADWSVGLNSKLMGQIQATRVAIEYLNPNGSITLTSGILSDEFIAGGTSASTVNGAIDHFVQAVATELPKGIRINVVSPALLVESVEALGGFFPGFEPVAGKRVAQAYVKSIAGVMSGRVFKVT